MTIPIVGQQFNLLSWYPTANITCRCDETRLVFITLTGQAWSQCPLCKRSYSIERIDQNGAPVILMHVPVEQRH